MKNGRKSKESQNISERMKKIENLSKIGIMKNGRKSKQ